MTNQIDNTHNAEIDLEIGTLTIAELDAAGGGMDNNYKECTLGTTAGGAPGLYPWYATCRTK
jgi:hypothetical protein